MTTGVVDQTLTPDHLLRLQIAVDFPPGLFGGMMFNIWPMSFFCRWRREYLVLLNPRQKWTSNRHNLKPGHVVLVRDEASPRNHWITGRVETVDADQIGDVRSLRVRTACKFADRTKTKEIRRPINKLILISEVECSKNSTVWYKN